MFIFGFITGAVIVTVIICSYTTSKINTANTQSQQKQQKMQAHHKSELAAKDTRIADLENEVAYYQDLQKSFSSRWQQLIDRERKVEERERLAEGLADSLVAEREFDLERRERNLEDIIARRVDADIKGKQKGVDDNWTVIKREKRTLAANNEKCNNRSASLDEREQKMYEKAILISNHLGVPLKSILNPREKKLVGKIANELTEEQYALMDLVMSCPADQAKDLLASMQQFQKSWRR